MKVTITCNCRAEGQHFSIGDEVELSESIAKTLIGIGKAAPVAGVKVHDYATDNAEPAPAPEPTPKPKPSAKSAAKSTSQES